MPMARLMCDPERPQRNATALEMAMDASAWVQLLGPHAHADCPDEAALPEGPGLLLSGGGSSGERRLCLQPWRHLDASAAATGDWLRSIGLQPERSWVFNPLPFQ